MRFFTELAGIGKTVASRLGFVGKRVGNAVGVFTAGVKRVVIRPVISGLLAFVQHMPRVFAAVVAVLTLAAATTAVAVATGATAAFDVMYEGTAIGTVKSAAVLAEAEILAAKKLNNADCNRYLIKTSLSQTLAAADRLIESSALADILIDQSDEITTAAVLCIGGQQVAMEAEEASVQGALADYLNRYQQEQGLDAVELCSEIQVLSIYMPKSAFAQYPCVSDYLAENSDPLPVQTVNTVVETREIPYETVKIESATYTVGTERVTQSGVNGVEEVTYKVAVVDGVQTEKTEISSRVVTAPVECRITVGTKRIIAADKNGSAPMVWPVKRVSGSYVSSYMGDGRGHKGMDIAAPAGTPIYAAESGTVVSAAYDGSGYGNRIIIRHAGGLETLYAHCSALYVKVGDTVAAGETVAAVGRTGNSTGNHLHFEVRKNGTIVNPSYYIGSN